MSKNNHIVDANKMIPTISECVEMFKRMGMKGWPVMDKDGEWMLCDFDPQIYETLGRWCSHYGNSYPFTAQPVSNWKQSKRRVE